LELIGVSSEHAVSVTEAADAKRIFASKDWAPAVPLLNAFDLAKLSFPVLVGLGPELHDQHKRAIGPAFLPVRMEEWDPVLSISAHELLEGRQGPMFLGADYARPLATRVACLLVGIDPALSPQVRRIVAPLFGNPTLSESAQRLVGLRLYRLLMKNEIFADPGSPVPILAQEVATQGDRLAAAFSMLTAGTELVARAILAVLSAEMGVNGRSTRLSSVEVNRAISESEIIPMVLRRHSLTDREIGVSLRPTLGEGSLTLPFGFGRHHCLGASWCRVVCRIATETIERHGSIEITDIDRMPAGQTLGGIRELAANFTPLATMAKSLISTDEEVKR
jgi:cytochrome P450